MEELDDYVEEYLAFRKCYNTVRQFNTERKGNEDSGQNLSLDEIKTIKGEILDELEAANYAQVLYLWDKHFVQHLDVRPVRLQIEAYSTEFYINLYCATFPFRNEVVRELSSPQEAAQMAARSMTIFKNYVETRGNELLTLQEFEVYKSLPKIAFPPTHPSFSHLFKPDWTYRSRNTIESFINKFFGLALEDPPYLLTLFMGKNNSVSDIPVNEVHRAKMERDIKGVFRIRERKLMTFAKSVNSISNDLLIKINEQNKVMETLIVNNPKLKIENPVTDSYIDAIKAKLAEINLILQTSELGVKKPAGGESIQTVDSVPDTLCFQDFGKIERSTSVEICTDMKIRQNSCLRCLNDLVCALQEDSGVSESDLSEIIQETCKSLGALSLLWSLTANKSKRPGATDDGKVESSDAKDVKRKFIGCNWSQLVVLLVQMDVLGISSHTGEGIGNASDILNKRAEMSVLHCILVRISTIVSVGQSKTHLFGLFNVSTLLAMQRLCLLLAVLDGDDDVDVSVETKGAIKSISYFHTCPDGFALLISALMKVINACFMINDSTLKEKRDRIVSVGHGDHEKLTFNFKLIVHYLSVSLEVPEEIPQLHIGGDAYYHSVVNSFLLLFNKFSSSLPIHGKSLMHERSIHVRVGNGEQESVGYDDAIILGFLQSAEPASIIELCFHDLFALSIMLDGFLNTMQQALDDGELVSIGKVYMAPLVYTCSACLCLIQSPKSILSWVVIKQKVIEDGCVFSFILEYLFRLIALFISSPPADGVGRALSSTASFLLLSLMHIETASHPSLLKEARMKNRLVVKEYVDSTDMIAPWKNKIARKCEKFTRKEMQRKLSWAELKIVAYIQGNDKNEPKATGSVLDANKYLEEKKLLVQNGLKPLTYTALNDFAHI